jgi:hypothetical protein
MQALIDQTLAAMERECHLYEALLALAEEQRSCLIGGRAVRLEEIVQEQSDLVRRAGHAARRTEVQIDGLARSLALPAGSRASELARVLPGQAGQRCLGLRRRLLSLADDLRRLGKINHRLAVGALGYIDFSLRLIGGAGAVAQPYGQDGSPPPNQPGRLVVDTRV